MKKNRSTSDSDKLAALVLNKRSGAYKDLCAITTDEEGFQSDEAAARLRDETQTVLVKLLKGEYDDVNRKLAEHVGKPSSILVQSPTTWKQNGLKADYLNSIRKKIRLGGNDAYLVTLRSTEVTAEEIAYDLVKRSLESGDIQYFALCRNEKCGKL